MAEHVTAQTEIALFAWIMEHPEQIEKVDSSFFKVSDEIRFIYDIIKKEYLKSLNKEIPSPEQIRTMVKMNDTENKISDGSLKVLLKASTNSYQKEWLEKIFKGWKLSNSLRNQVTTSIEILRDLDEVDYDKSLEVYSKIKDAFADVITVDDDDEDLGSSFYDPENHKQNVKLNKISSGWNTMDKILSGGWDLSTLNVIMGETNIGKSMWLHNIASNAVKSGFNVVIITLEMATYKCIKRIGSMLLGIHPDIYDEKSLDTQYIQNKINEFKATANTDSLFDGKVGELIIKKFNTSDCSITDLENYIKKLKDRKRIKIDMLVIDYLNIMSVEKGVDKTSLYMKGKHLAEGLRYIADKHKCAVITATQTDRAVWGASDLKLDSVPESKAIAETADSMWGIIRTPEMKKQKLYRLKNLKLRDGECKDSQILFHFKVETLTMENDNLVS